MKITVLGDIMIDNDTAKTLDNYVKEERFCFDSMFTGVKHLLSKSDYVFANLETPISYDNSDLTNIQWQFCSPREFAEAVKNVGVDFVSTANNHCLDRGIKGIINTISVLDEIGLSHTGTYKTNTSKSLSVIDIKGIKIGCLAYTYGTNAVTNHHYLGKDNRKLVDLIQEQEGYMDLVSPIKKCISRHPRGFFARCYNLFERLLFPENIGKQWFEKRTFDLYRRYLLNKDIRRIKRKSDLQIMLLHIGGQYNEKPNDYTVKTVERLLKKNIDIIIANHEHVVHGHIYNYSKNSIATYSLGNFIGGTGVICPPFDKKSEYSIAVHIYIDDINKSIKKISFSVLKTIVDESGKISVHQAYDISQNNSTFSAELLSVAKAFSNKEYCQIEREFVLYE